MKLTTREMIYYFGLLFDMKLKQMKSRLESLQKLLDLSAIDALCNTLRLA